MPQRRKSADTFTSHFPQKIPIQDAAYYSRRESAAALGLHYMTLAYAERKGLKPSYAGGKVLYRGSDLRRWLSGDEE